MFSVRKLCLILYDQPSVAAYNRGNHLHRWRFNWDSRENGNIYLEATAEKDRSNQKPNHSVTHLSSPLHYKPTRLHRELVRGLRMIYGAIRITGTSSFRTGCGALAISLESPERISKVWLPAEPPHARKELVPGRARARCCFIIFV